MTVLPTCMSVYHVHGWSMRRSEEVIGFYRMRVMMVVRLWSIMWLLGIKPGSSSTATNLQLLKHLSIPKKLNFNSTFSSELDDSHLPPMTNFLLFLFKPPNVVFENLLCFHIVTNDDMSQNNNKLLEFLDFRNSFLQHEVHFGNCSGVCLQALSQVCLWFCFQDEVLLTYAAGDVWTQPTMSQRLLL